MWSGNSALIVINAFIILVHSLPSNIDQSTLRNNLDPVDQNERILKLFLQLAAHTANRLTHLRKETKRYDCNRRNDNPVSTTEILVTQSSPQANLEWLDESRQILTRSFLGDLEINSNQTVLHSQLQHQSPEFDLSDRQNINDRNVARDSKMSNLITKSVKGIQETSSDVTGHNREALNSLQKSIRNLDTARNSQNASEFGLDSPKSTRNINDLQNQIDLAKDITNTMDDLTGTVNKFFPHSQDLQGSTFGISQRLFGADLAQNVPKVINDVYANRHIPQNTRESSDRSDDVSQTFFDVINNSGNVLTPSTANNLSAMNQTLSSTKNIMESMTKVLPEAAKDASNLLNQIIPKSHDIINSSLKIAEESQKYLVHSGYIQQELSKNTKPTENQSDNQFHSRQDLTSNSGDSNAASERDNQETKANSSLPINQNNLEGEDNNQFPATSSNDSSILSVRFFPDFNGEETNNTTESDLFSVQPNKDLNNFTEENLSQTISYNETDQRLDQTDRQIKVGEFKKLNETGYGDDQLNPILEESSQRSTESGSTDVAVATSASPDQTESSTFALVSITERPANGSSDAQDFRNASDVTKVNAEETGRPQDKSSTNDEINRPIKSEITHCDDKVLESNGSLIGELTSEDSRVQLSEAKLQKISDRLINALRSYLEKKTDNRRYATDQWDNNLRSNISSDSKQINEQDSNLKNQDQIEDATLHLQKENYNRRKEAVNKRR